MTDGSSPTNRHGIPLRGNPPKRCIWDRCPNAAAKHLDLPLCQAHTEVVYTAVANDEDRMIARVMARRRQLEAETKAAKAKPKAAPAERVEAIYYLQIAGHIKIGWTSNLDQRMRNYPPNTQLLAIHPGSRDEEKQLHRRFAVHRSHGNEWYPLVPVLLDHIKRVIAEHGEPPTMIFGARPTEVRVPKAKPQLQAKYGPMLRG